MTERHLRVTTAEYTVADDVVGIDGEAPVVHLWGRTLNSDERVHVPVSGFDPYFVVPTSAAQDQAVELARDDRVRAIEVGEQPLGADYDSCSRIVVRLPEHVGELRDAFDTTYEADVLFPQRFCVDRGIASAGGWATVSGDPNGNGRWRVDQVTGCSDPPDADVRPRIVTIDIEVAQPDDAPAVVSETGIETTPGRITAVTLHDDYDDVYCIYVLACDEWRSDLTLCAPIENSTVQVFDSERQLLQATCTLIADSDPDVLTAWNAEFDYPYLVNRCHSLHVGAVDDLSPVGTVRSMPGDGQFVDGRLSGRTILDMMDAFQKTEYRALDSHALADVADAVLDDTPKLAVEDIDATYRDDPQRFVDYNHRDVQATVRINRERGVL